jgi:AbrB family looped-hinge helix DNA binding protein
MATQQSDLQAIAAVKVGASRQVAIPKKIHDRLGLKAGDYLEIAVEDDRIILTPKVLVDRRIAEGLADFKAGRTLGPFHTAREAMRALRARKR